MCFTRSPLSLYCYRDRVLSHSLPNDPWIKCFSNAVRPPREPICHDPMSSFHLILGRSLDGSDGLDGLDGWMVRFQRHRLPAIVYSSWLRPSWPVPLALNLSPTFLSPQVYLSEFLALPYLQRPIPVTVPQNTRSHIRRLSHELLS